MSTAVLVIDMQVNLTSEGYNAEQAVANVRGVVDRARSAGLPIIFVQHSEPNYPPLNPGQPGWELDPGLGAQPEDLRIEKFSSDSFTNTKLADELAARGITHLIVGGMQSDFCVDSTCRVAMSKGFNITLLEDGHTTMDSVIPAAQVIAHHNHVLANIGFPGSLEVKPAAEVLSANAVG